MKGNDKDNNELVFTSPEIKPPREDIRDGVERNIRATLKNVPPEKLASLVDGVIYGNQKDSAHEEINKILKPYKGAAHEIIEKLDIGEIQNADKENFHKLTNKLPENTKEKLYKAIDLYRSASQEIKNHATNTPIIRELGGKEPTNNRGKNKRNLSAII